MKLIIRMESLDEPFLIDIVRQVREKIFSDKDLQAIDLPQIEAGLVVSLRIYPKADFTYPKYAQIIKSFKKKDKLLVVSSNIEIESLIGLNQDEIYNVFLNAIIDAMNILSEKKIIGADVEYMRSRLKKYLLELDNQ